MGKKTFPEFIFGKRVPWAEIQITIRIVAFIVVSTTVLSVANEWGHFDLIVSIVALLPSFVDSSSKHIVFGKKARGIIWRYWLYLQVSVKIATVVTANIMSNCQLVGIVFLSIAICGLLFAGQIVHESTR